MMHTDSPSRRAFPGASVLAVMVLVCTMAFGCGVRKINSTWRDREITIDGVAREWQEARSYVKDPNVAVGVMNDEEYLYVCLSTPVRSVAARIVALGFTVWFDPKGGKSETFGIRCPIGAERFSVLREVMEDPERLEEMFETSAAELEILGPTDADHLKTSNSGTHGIEVGMMYKDGTFGYELKVPLSKSGDQRYAVACDMNQPLGIGFVTPRLDPKAMKEAMDGQRPMRPRGPGGGMGGRGTGGGRMGGGGMRGRGGPEQLKIWSKVTLTQGVRSCN